MVDICVYLIINNEDGFNLFELYLESCHYKSTLAKVYSDIQRRTLCHEIEAWHLDSGSQFIMLSIVYITLIDFRYSPRNINGITI